MSEPGNRIELRDSRRLTGPNLLWDLAGAIADVACPEELIEDFIRRWSEAASKLLAGVGWGGSRIVHRLFPGGANVALAAPMDGLYAATEVNELAVEWARAGLERRPVPDLQEGITRLREMILTESNPALSRLIEEAASRGVACITDDEQASVGMGSGSITFEVRSIPDVREIPWDQVHDIPVALITGTNGKSTTVRMVAAMVREAGRVPGSTSTDGIEIGDELVEAGDYSGPSGARKVLRDRRVEVAILETARGGMLRRGLGIRRADAAAVTNLGADHLGEFGVADRSSLLETKLIVSRAVGHDSLLVLNAEDETLAARGSRLGLPTGWYAVDGGNRRVRQARSDGTPAAWMEQGGLHLSLAGERTRIMNVEAAPATLGGAALHNVSNALAAILLGSRLGMEPDACARGLAGFGGASGDNPGRCNLYELGGVKAMVDFAHNPHGFRALFKMARRMEARRVLILIGQAGDRDDESIREMARITWEARPDRIVIKEMTKYLRGREPGAIPELIRNEFTALGAPEGILEMVASEMEGVEKALAWARPGDLLLLTSHAEREALLDLMERLRKGEWMPGHPLPEA